MSGTSTLWPGRVGIAFVVNGCLLIQSKVDPLLVNKHRFVGSR